MKVLINCQARFSQVGDEFYSHNLGTFPLWMRYLDVFDEIGIVARAYPCDAPRDGWSKVNQPRISMHPIPAYHGPWQYLRQAGRIQRILKQTIQEYDAFLLRVPDHIGWLISRELRRQRIPYGVEVVGDPWGVLAPKAIRCFGRPYFRWALYRRSYLMCAGAAASLYVTNRALQQRYPSPRAQVTLGCSDVFLPPEAFADDQCRSMKQNRWAAWSTATPPTDEDPVRLLFVGTLNTMVKAPDILLRAAALCRQRGLPVHLTMVGDGIRRIEMEQLAARLGIRHSVDFKGLIPSGEPVRKLIDAADIFLLVSYSEGQSRVLLEAMARGSICIGSDVGGIVELLDREDRVRPGSPDEIADRVQQWVTSPGLLREKSERNHATAQGFRDDVLIPKRRAFYETYKQIVSQRHERRAACRSSKSRAA